MDKQKRVLLYDFETYIFVVQPTQFILILGKCRLDWFFGEYRWHYRMFREFSVRNQGLISHIL